MFKNVLIYFLTSLILVSCGENKKIEPVSSSPTKKIEQVSSSPTKKYQAYKASAEKLKNTGVLFSTTNNKGKSNIKLSFDELNKKVREISSINEKIKLLSSALDAMNRFNEKSLTLIKSNTLKINEQNILIKKQKMLKIKLGPIKELITSHKNILKLEENENDFKISKGFSTQIGASSLYLCDLKNKYLEGLSSNKLIKYDLILIKIILCSNKENVSKFSMIIKGSNSNDQIHHDTNLYIEVEKGSEFQPINIPTNTSLVKSKNITNKYDYYDDESPATLPLAINVSLLDFLYLIDINKVDSQDLINFIKNHFINNNENIKTFFEQNYDKKNEIVEKFNSTKIKILLSSKFETAIIKTTDEIIQLIISKDYYRLKAFANAQNINKVSYNDTLQINASFSAYGFSPLMVAAILDDKRATKILLEVEGININLESPIFRKTYATIKEVKISIIKYLQSTKKNKTYSGVMTGGKLISFPRNPPQKYKGYTALMIAVAENKCELVDTIIEAEEYSLNYRTLNGATALSISIDKWGHCLKQLIQAGAFDVNIFRFQSNKVSYLVRDSLYFIKYVDDNVFQKEEVRTLMPEILTYSNLDLELKKELIKKVPLSIENFRLLITERISLYNIESKKEPLFNTKYPDLDFVNFMGVNLAKEKLFGKEIKRNFFSHMLRNIHQRSRGNRINDIKNRVLKLLNPIYKVNPKWVTDWLNSSNSFEGHNPLILASIFNEVGIVQGLLSIEGIDVNVTDQKTGYNALEWQYNTNSFMWYFTKSQIASDLISKGALIQSENVNFLGKPSREAKNAMTEKRDSIFYPFIYESLTTKNLKQ